MNNLTQLMKECSKRRPVTFSDISFPISQEIETKIKSKNVSLRRKIHKIIQTKNKCVDKESSSAGQFGAGKAQGEEDGSEDDQIDYLQAFVQQEKVVTQDEYGLCFARERHQLKEEEAAIRIYYLVAKKKHIFKVEHVLRRLKKPQMLLKKISLKECDCCGSIGRHQCQHLFCENACRKIKRRKRHRQTKSLPSDYDQPIQCNDVKKEENPCQNIEPSSPPQQIHLNPPQIPERHQEEIYQQSSSSEQLEQDMVFLSSQSSYG